MKIMQSTNNKIENYFRNSGVSILFNALSSSVNNSEIDTDQLCAWCTKIIEEIKVLHQTIKNCEKEWIKQNNLKNGE